MAPTLHHGDRLLVLRTPLVPIRRGSVVVARPPASPPDWQAAQALAYSRLPAWVVKRVAGLPGDVLTPRQAAADQAVRVPPRHVYLLGDSEPSVDSRLWGPIPIDRILGVAITRLARASVAGRAHTSEAPASPTPVPTYPDA